MTITDDYKIFADKYHNKQHIPDDLIKNIMKINTDIIKQEKIKQNYQLVINDIDTIYNSDSDGDCFTLKEIIESDDFDIIYDTLYIKLFIEIDNLKLSKIRMYSDNLDNFYEHFMCGAVSNTRTLQEDNGMNEYYIQDFYRLFPERFNTLQSFYVY